jgi:hypothetical protein
MARETCENVMCMCIEPEYIWGASTQKCRLLWRFRLVVSAVIGPAHHFQREIAPVSARVSVREGAPRVLSADSMNARLRAESFSPLVLPLPVGSQTISWYRGGWKQFIFTVVHLFKLPNHT